MAYISLQIGSEVAPDIMQTYASDDEIVYGIWFRRPSICSDSSNYYQRFYSHIVHRSGVSHVLVTCYLP